MANIKNTYICPRCEEGISAVEKPEVCPNCHFKLAMPGSGGFAVPTTIAEQQERIGDKKAHTEFILSLHIDTANNIMNDALNIIQTIPSKKVRTSDIRNLMGMAIQIGDIARKYEEFLKVGGAHTPELLIISGDDNEQSANGNGEKTTSSIPTPLFSSVDKNK